MNIMTVDLKKRKQEPCFIRTVSTRVFVMVLCRGTIQSYLNRRTEFYLVTCCRAVHDAAVVLHLKKLKIWDHIPDEQRSSERYLLLTPANRGDVCALQMMYSTINLPFCVFGDKLAFLECVHVFDNSELTDVSALFNAKTVRFMNCPALEDLSPLKRVVELVVIRCRRITGLGPRSSLSSVKSVVVGDCNRLVDVAALTNSTECSVRIRNCKRIQDVSPLADCCSVQLQGCDCITDISALGHVRQLTVQQCNSIVGNFQFITPEVRTVSISHCEGFNDLSGLEKVRDRVFLCNLSNLTDITPLINFKGQEICISGSPHLNSFDYTRFRYRGFRIRLSPSSSR